MIDLIWLIPLLPFIGFLINGLGGRYLPKSVVGIIGSATVLVSFVLSILVFFELGNSEVKSFTVQYFDWISAGSLQIPFSFLMDPLASVMLLVITGVGFLIHVYSIGYMHHDEGFARFFSYLNLFVFFMLLLVMGSNYPILFIGWEGVGLCSYLLIGFWFRNTDYNNAAKKAFVMNRIGDLGFLLGMFLIFQTFGSLNYADVFNKASFISEFNTPVSIAITLLLFVGATGKSAQIPLYTWLPDAMAGPTPVSALIHAATMVTAGIYMIARSNILYVLAPFSMDVVTIVGAATAIFAALIALTQNDIKKVLAYSTVSQLGYMFVALGIGSFSSGIFHLMTHAFFKALLFLGAGSVIHAMSNEQDIRNMGGLRKKLPVTFFVFLAGTLAIIGFPPFAGFFSKDEILAFAYTQNRAAFWVLALTSILTCLYMFRMFFLTFFGAFRGTVDQQKRLHESPAVMTIPLTILALFSAIGGFFGMSELFSEHHALKEFLSPVFSVSSAMHSLAVPSHSLEYAIIVAGFIVIAMLTFFTYARYARPGVVFPADGKPVPFFQRLSYNKFYVDELYDLLFTKPLNVLSGAFYHLVDVTGIDGVVNSFGKAAMWSSARLRLLQSGNIGFYIFAMVIGVVLIILYSFIG